MRVKEKAPPSAVGGLEGIIAEALNWLIIYSN